MDTEGSPIIVDDIANSDLRPYRLPLLRRLSESPRLSVTIWHGDPAPGIGAPPTPIAALPIPDHRIGNVFWPWGAHRVAWQRGSLGVLRSPSQVIVCAEVVHNLSIWFIALTHRFFRKRLVLRGYFYRPRGEGRIKGLARRVLHRLGDSYIAYTDRGRQDLISEGRPPERIFVSQNTLDVDSLTNLAKQVDVDAVQRLRQAIGVKTDHVILYLGRLLPVKGVMTAVEAMRHIDGAELVIVGDGRMREPLEQAASGLSVHFVGAIYDESVLAPYFRMAEVLTLPGRVGLTCVHGFANSLPCVTTVETVVEQSPEYDYIVHGYNGLILPDQDPVTHADAIRCLLDDPERLERLRHGAGETAARLCMASMVRGYEGAVDAALTLRPS